MNNNIRNELSKRIMYLDKKFIDSKIHHELKHDLTEHISKNYNTIYKYHAK